MGGAPSDEFEEGMEEISSVDKECPPFQNPEMTIGKIKDEDPDNLQD